MNPFRLLERFWNLQVLVSSTQPDGGATTVNAIGEDTTKTTFSSHVDPLSDAQIRLARIEPGMLDDPITLSTEVHDPKDVEYYYIAYDRSKSNDTSTITVDGQWKEVPKSLEAALRASRQNHQPQRLWFDKLTEFHTGVHSNQVNTMASAVTNATAVRYRLGGSTANITEDIAVVDMIQQLSAGYIQVQSQTGMPDLMQVATMRQIQNTVAMLATKTAEYPQLQDAAFVTRLQDVLADSYFATVHATPELTLANDIQLCIGISTITWSQFRSSCHGLFLIGAILQIELRGDFTRSSEHLLRLQHTMGAWRAGQNHELLVNVVGARFTKYNDPRDIIFASLPMAVPCDRTADDADRPASPKQDASKTAVEVFKETAKYIVLDRQDFLLWRHERPPCGRRMLGLPSWVPDWSRGPAVNGKMVSMKSGLRRWADPLQRKRIRVDENYGLHVEAHALDRVSYVSEIFTAENCRRLCVELQKLHLSRPTKLTPMEAFEQAWRTLVLNWAGLTPGSLVVSPPPKELAGSFASLLCEEYLIRALNCTTLGEALSDENIPRIESNPQLSGWREASGHSSYFVDVMAHHSLGRRFFYTESGRIGMTSVETPAPPDTIIPLDPEVVAANYPDLKIPAAGGAAGDFRPDFTDILNHPFMGDALLGFMQQMQSRDAKAARVLQDAIDGQWPTQTPPGIRVGDLVVAIVGGYQPYVLSPLGGKTVEEDEQDTDDRPRLSKDRSYRYVGDCYLHGAMDGEPMQAGKSWGWFGQQLWKDVGVVDITIV